MDIPAGYHPFVDAILRSLDPRLTPMLRQKALLEALAEPEFALGVLTQVVIEYHERAERLGALPAGTLVDKLRARAFSRLPAADVLGYALNGAKAGEQVEILTTDPDTLGRAVLERGAPTQDPGTPPGVNVGYGNPAEAHARYFTDRYGYGGPPRDGDLRRLDTGQLQEWGSGRWHNVQEPPVAEEPMRFPLRVRDDAPMIPHPSLRPGRPIGEVAAEAEAAHRARLQREMTGQDPTWPDHPYPGGSVRRDVEAPVRVVDGKGGHEFPHADFANNGINPLPPERLAGLLENLRRQRADEAAVDAADPDDPRSMPGAGHLPGNPGGANLDPAEEPPTSAPRPPAQGGAGGVQPALGRTYLPQGGSGAQRGPEAPLRGSGGTSSNGGNPPPVPLCNHMTASGPCVLRKGHPELPVPGTEMGHLSAGAAG